MFHSTSNEISAHHVSFSAVSTQEEKMSLKVLSSKNIDDFMEWATDDEVTSYMMWNSYKSREEAEVFFANVVEKHPWFKAICLGEKVIGSMTLDKGKGAHSCKAELGYVIARKYWGKGYVTAAIKLALATGFSDLDINRIEAYVDPENIGSQRVLEKNGFSREGLLRKFVVQKGVIKDRYIYSVSDMKGFSLMNIKYMIQFAKKYPDFKISQQLSVQILYYHIILIINKLSSIKERFWYIKQTIENSWSRSVLDIWISSNLQCLLDSHPEVFILACYRLFV